MFINALHPLPSILSTTINVYRKTELNMQHGCHGDSVLITRFKRLSQKEKTLLQASVDQAVGGSFRVRDLVHRCRSLHFVNDSYMAMLMFHDCRSSA